MMAIVVSSVLVLKTSSNTTIELQRNIILNFFNQLLNFFTSFSRAKSFKPPFQVRSGIHWRGSEKRKVCGRSSCCYTEKKQTAFPKMGDGILQAIDESVRCTSRENVLDKSRVITWFIIELIYNRDCNEYNDL